MIDVAVQAENWPEHDWQALAERACCAAAAASEFNAFLTYPTPIEIAIRLTSDAEVHALNRDYRDKDAPTNVLSFPMLEGEELADLISAHPERSRGTTSSEVEKLGHVDLGSARISPSTSLGMSGDCEDAETPEPETLLGDIILAYETCAREAAIKNIRLEAHATHLIVHGTLHLLGYDHIDDDEACVMETLERTIMAGLGLHDPYDDEDD